VLAGFHVNYSGDLPSGWEQFLVAPKQSCRVFA